MPETTSTGSLFGRPRAEVAAALPDREQILCPLCQCLPQRFAVDFQGLSLVRCPRCGLQFHCPRPVLEQMATAVYGAAYHRADEATADARHERHYGRQIAELERHHASPGRRLLDVGCGAGAFVRFAGARGWDTEGTDVVVTEWARGAGVRLWEGELPSISFGNTQYDVVRFNHVLEHTRDPLHELRRARELIVREGLLLVGVPNLAGLSPWLKSWQSRLGLKTKRWRHYAALHHLWFFTPGTLRQLVTVAGFRVVHWETPTMGRVRSRRTPYGALLETARLGSVLDLYARVD